MNNQGHLQEGTKRNRQEYCDNCGNEIKDSNIECPHCGYFNERAYHEKASDKISANAKYLQASSGMQQNQRISENQKEYIIKYNDFN